MVESIRPSKQLGDVLRPYRHYQLAPKRMQTDLIRSSKQLGSILRGYRCTQSLTQTQLAKRAGVRQSTISQVESGLEAVKLTTMMNILRALDLELTIRPRTKGAHSDLEDLF